jgi:hypothetical protein
MFLYVVYDDWGDEGYIVNSVYDEETFKKVYNNFTTNAGLSWAKGFAVVRLQMNKDSINNDYTEIERLIVEE